MSFIKKPEVDVTTAVVVLTETMARVERAHEAESAVMTEKTNAIVAANKVQADFDALVNHLRATAPKGTSWEIQYGPD